MCVCVTRGRRQSLHVCNLRMIDVFCVFVSSANGSRRNVTQSRVATYMRIIPCRLAINKYLTRCRIYLYTDICV